ncbi:hypothetical protein GCM10017771_88010 [Streptomyces capitiformicae]|uniref:Uncharacterized protein n=1 Tax=Streptomyces capitiformicae TaxID=2014920 RepID=A0A918ZQD5_9ACTN|nr:hypothetical protein GCM10017771_88010 [Streptomyces capitiformicae]
MARESLLSRPYLDLYAARTTTAPAKTGEFLGSRRAIRAEVDHEAPADTDRFGEGIDLGDGGNICSGAGGSLKRSWSVRVPRQGSGRPRKRPDRVRADKAYGSPRGVAWACRVADSGFSGGRGRSGYRFGSAH